VIELESWLIAVDNLVIATAFVAAFTLSSLSVANFAFESFKITVKSSICLVTPAIFAVKSVTYF
jgi:hypothetical protein